MTVPGHNGGNCSRAQIRVRSSFAHWWAPWERCRGRARYTRRRCELRRLHLSRHAWSDGFDVHYFDAARDGTP